ncbi:hypothetical protein GGR06_004113, partial [Bacteroides reticulotermitis]|nr:hypothetical protein [Bacteroides reticulotermitis]MBB4046279.1 hypothetical protein [Bacteroides reticulotermitis]
MKKIIVLSALIMGGLAAQAQEQPVVLGKFA